MVRNICLNHLSVCDKMADWIRMPFGVVSGVGPGIGVLDGVHVQQGKGAVSTVFCPHWPIGFNGVFCNRNIFDSCTKSWQYFRRDKISLESTFHWLYENIVKFKADAGVCGQFEKNVTVDICKMDVLPHGAAIRCQGCQVIFSAHCQT